MAKIAHPEAPHPAPRRPIMVYNWSLIAADLVRCGGQPEALHSLPGMDEETASELSALMTAHAAAGVTAIAAASR